MRRCPACQEEVPLDARFCGQCGFRLSPISAEVYRERTRSRPPLFADEATPVTMVKPEEACRKPRLEIVEASPPAPAAASRPRAKASRQLEVVGPADLAVEPAQGLMQPAVPLLPPLFPEPVAQPSPRPSVPTAPPEDPSPQPHEPASAAEAAAQPEPAAAPRRKTFEQQRRFRRFPLKVEVSYTSDHNFFTGFMQNIGEGGLFVATHTPAQLGELIEVNFTVPGLDRVCTALCRVRWIREFNPGSTDTVPGMGLQFAQLESDVRAAIDCFIEHREPIFYDD